MAFIKDVNYFTPKEKPEVDDGEVSRQELALLLNTRPTEKLFDSNYGVALEDYLFDIISNENANSIYFELVDKIKIYVSSVILDETRSDVTPTDDLDGYDITLVFQLKNADSDGNNYIVTKKVTRDV